jgi:hypothetical protein
MNAQHRIYLPDTPLVTPIWRLDEDQMHAQQTQPQISNAEPVPMSLIRDRADASYDYADNARDRFEAVTRRDLDHDEAALNAVAAAIAVLTCAITSALQSGNYIEGRSSKAELIEQLCDLAEDALGQAGPVVRAQARIDGAR